jgi:mono/diheme cytochrome c family protein
MVMKPEGTVADIVEAEQSVADYDEGSALYITHCLRCHGLGAKSTGLLPDLRLASKEVHDSWSAIVIGGMYKDKGMDSFSNVLSGEQAEKIHGYIIREALKEPGLAQEFMETISPHFCIPPTWMAN